MENADTINEDKREKIPQNIVLLKCSAKMGDRILPLVEPDEQNTIEDGIT